MLKKFFKDNDTLIKLTGSLTAIAGLFLSIQPSESEDALSSLGNIQALMVSAFTLCAIAIMWKFLKAVWHEEKNIFRRLNMPNLKAFTLIVAYSSLFISLMLVSFALNAYPQTHEPFNQIALTLITFAIAGGPILMIERDPAKFSRYTIMISVGFSLAVLITYITAVLGFALKKHIPSDYALTFTLIISFSCSCIAFAISSFIFRNAPSKPATNE